MRGRKPLATNPRAGDAELAKRLYGVDLESNHQPDNGHGAI
jgi:hypothetical protein